jgi:hypothetical protein
MDELIYAPADPYSNQISFQDLINYNLTMLQKINEYIDEQIESLTDDLKKSQEAGCINSFASAYDSGARDELLNLKRFIQETFYESLLNGS